MKHMEKEALVKLLCSGYCSFYKPGKKEELACKGFFVLQKLLDERKEVPVRTEKIVLGIKTESALFRLLCEGCPFFGQDCDFAAWKRGEGGNTRREAVNPCGGFLCLGHCIDHGTVDIQDINRVM